MRWFNNYFAFWHVCETRVCKRTKRCTGDADACMRRFMPLVPYRVKFEVNATLKAKSDGLSPEAVMPRVKEEMARFDETTRILERLDYATGSSSPRPAQRGEGGEQQSGDPGDGACHDNEPSPALASRGHPLPQAGEGNAPAERPAHPAPLKREPMRPDGAGVEPA